jgi:serine/threonine protein kinase
MPRARTLNRESGPVFGFQPGRRVERYYVLGDFIGAGYEGEVYHLTEHKTGIERVIKFFYPHRHRDPRRSIRLARKLHRLRHCSVILQYHHHGELAWQGRKIPYMVSDLASGQMLHQLIQRQPRKRFHPFEALSLTYAIACGVAEMHDLGEYHGDIHEDNILVERRGVAFDIKLIDLYLHARWTANRLKMDVLDLAWLLYQLVGGPAGYSGSPKIIKEIVCGRRTQTICRKFATAGDLCRFVEQYPWPAG